MTIEAFYQAYPGMKPILESVFKDGEAPVIEPIKKGMTNTSFILSFRNTKKRFVVRIPGAGADELIDRLAETRLYGLLKDQGITENVLYIHPDNGIKISEYYEHSRALDPMDDDEVRMCIALLKKLHTFPAVADNVYDFFFYVEDYERLRKGAPSVFGDYEETKKNVLALRTFVDGHKKPFCLIHNDISPDNCLIIENENGKIARLIDWEYAAMQDPDSDIAYFCVSAEYTPERIETVVDLYLDGKDDALTRTMVYAYIAVNALVQSNWMEYKFLFGEGDKASTQAYYDLARRYCAKAMQNIEGGLF